ncbi:MAG TPA: copper resistance CopC family protein [Vicinamibacterales bacterium]|nr:copper resistance CopC family protein [Vicinamibacterales bacterium]
MRLRRVVAATLAICLMLPAALLAHLAVVKSAPARGEKVAKPPERIQVWFNQPPSERVSHLELDGPAGKVALEKVEVDRTDKSISARVPASLEPGDYEVRWRTAGHDGHVIRGTFSFSVHSKASGR